MSSSKPNAYVSPNSASELLPPLNTSIVQMLEGLTPRDPTPRFLEQQLQLVQEKDAQEQRALDLEAQEEEEYQTAIAHSLDLPYITPTALTNGAVVAGPSKSSTPIPVRTVPNVGPKITHHMNEDWMRPVEDNTKKPQRLNRGDLDTRFTIIFWKEVQL